MAQDKWTNTESSSERADYTYEFKPNVGGFITATKGILTHRMKINEAMTREQVESEFRNFRIRADAV